MLAVVSMVVAVAVVTGRAVAAAPPNIVFVLADGAPQA